MTNLPKATDIMDKDFHKFSSEMDIAKVVDIMLKKKLIGGPVVNENDELLGVISERDCLKPIEDCTYFDQYGGIVKDYIHTDVNTVDKDMDMFAICKVLRKSHHRRVIVLDDKKVIGQITIRDMLKKIRRVKKKLKGKV